MSDGDWDPDRYLDDIRAEIPSYDLLQDAVQAATRIVDARRVLELGLGTGETARRLLDAHPNARLVGVDGSEPMASAARASLPGERADVRVQRLQEPLPKGPFDLVVSALAVHHLTSTEKRNLFARVASVLRAGGTVVLADIVVPDDPAEAVTPLEDGFDMPDRLDDQLDWLVAAGLKPSVVWRRDDLAVLRATKP